MKDILASLIQAKTFAIKFQKNLNSTFQTHNSGQLLITRMSIFNQHSLHALHVLPFHPRTLVHAWVIYSGYPNNPFCYVLDMLIYFLCVN